MSTPAANRSEAAGGDARRLRLRDGGWVVLVTIAACLGIVVWATLGVGFAVETVAIDPHANRNPSTPIGPRGRKAYRVAAETRMCRSTERREGEGSIVDPRRGFPPKPSTRDAR